MIVKGQLRWNLKIQLRINVIQIKYALIHKEIIGYSLLEMYLITLIKTLVL